MIQNKKVSSATGYLVLFVVLAIFLGVFKIAKHVEAEAYKIVEKSLTETPAK
jgi:hypothetical protein